MGKRRCKGVKADGSACKRAPAVDGDYCLAHDPERKDDHAEISRAGGIARHDPEVSTVKAEIADVKAALWSGKLTPGAGSVLLQAIRLEREFDREDTRDASGDALIESIRALRDSNPPDLSEPAANVPPGGMVDDLSEPDEPYDPDAPNFEDYRRADGSLDSEAYLRDVKAHNAPLDKLSIAERRRRWQSGQRWGRAQ